MKIHRVITQEEGHLFSIQYKGSGTQSLLRLAAFCAELHLEILKAGPGYTKDEWRKDLKDVIVQAGIQNQKTCLYMDQFMVQKENWFEDLEGILKNQILAGLF